MRVALIKPPLAGHEQRGTGIYTDQLLSQLKSIPEIEVVFSEFKSIPWGCDIYHFPYFDPFFLTLPSKIPQPMVVTVHDVIPLKFSQHFPVGIKGRYKFFLQKHRVTQARAIITDSHASKLDISTYLGVSPENIYPIYLAPDPIFTQKIDDRELKEIRKELKVPDSFVLYVGDVNWNKNLPTVIKAAKEINFPLVIVSKTFSEQDPNSNHRELQSLKEAQKLAQELSSLLVLSAIKPNYLAALYQSAVSLVFPSYYEGFGLPVVEAFASGCPVITTKGGSLGEIVGPAALITKAQDYHKIGQYIQEMAVNLKLRKHHIRLGQTQAKRFTWEKTAKETINVYNKILNQYA